MIDIESCKESLNPSNIYKWIVNQINFYRNNPDYFEADGLVVFCGPQGSGKSLSAVNYVYKLLEKFPKSIIVTNIILQDYPIVTFDEWLIKELERYDELDKLSFSDDLTEEEVNEKRQELYNYYYPVYLKNNRVFEFRDNDDFQRYENDDRGVIFLVDEIQLYLNSLASKNINMDVITQISQQRKQRKHIVCTSQVFGRLAKPLREQFSCVILCSSYFRFFQINKLIDRDSMDGDDSTGTNLKGTVKKKFFWFHHPNMYKRYDTYFVIDRNKFVSGEEQLSIYSNPQFINKEKEK